jgi:myo-inositol-1(or 4)-monophosphatase
VAIGDYAVGTDAAAKNAPRFALTRRLAETVQRVRMHGSAAIDLAFLAAGTVDAIIMLANNAWDVSAGVVIARESGALVLDVNGDQHAQRAAATVGVTPDLSDDLMDLISCADD